MKQLKSEFPGARIVREENHIDVLVETDHELRLYEIKSDLSPLSVLRQAIGQLLEYAYFYPARGQRRLQLVVVGRSSLSADGDVYLQHLQGRFSLPLTYRVVALDI
jgi:hypothetical protein